MKKINVHIKWNLEYVSNMESIKVLKKLSILPQ